MEITLTCEECGSGITIQPHQKSNTAVCDICQHEHSVRFDADHEKSILRVCPCCDKKDFYKQKDFNRKIGVILFVIAAILSIFTYGLSFVVLWLLDLFLFKKLNLIAICYSCQTIFRNVSNIDDIYDFNHEMNDRIIYAGHEFDGKPLEH